jgi:hypothetical protein
MRKWSNRAQSFGHCSIWGYDKCEFVRDQMKRGITRTMPLDGRWSAWSSVQRAEVTADKQDIPCNVAVGTACVRRQEVQNRWQTTLFKAQRSRNQHVTLGLTEGCNRGTKTVSVVGSGSLGGKGADHGQCAHRRPSGFGAMTRCFVLSILTFCCLAWMACVICATPTISTITEKTSGTFCSVASPWTWERIIRRAMGGSGSVRLELFGGRSASQIHAP